MQTIARDGLTAEQVKAIVESANLDVECGLDLLDENDALLEDISADLQNGVISRSNHAIIHGSCSLTLAREIDWSGQRVRPWMKLYAGGLSFRANLGVYMLVTPDRDAEGTPTVFDVEGFDKLYLLDTPVGRTYRVAAGTGHLVAVRAILTELGETKLLVSDESGDKPLPADRVWVLDEQNTWLRVVNDLLAALGYRGLWVDEEGFFRAEPYLSPKDSGAEWTYDADDQLRTIVDQQRSLESDLFDVPNQWVFVRDDPSLDLPVEGNGVYTVLNQSDGPASVDARKGTVRTRVIRLSGAADQAAMVVQGDRIVEVDKQVSRNLRVRTGPNPLHSHFDVVQVKDTALALDERFLSVSFTLPLNGEDMTHTMRAVA